MSTDKPEYFVHSYDWLVVYPFTKTDQPCRCKDVKKERFDILEVRLCEKIISDYPLIYIVAENPFNQPVL